ncbi:hypothetical protein [Algibacter sp. 2305UL17-15]|uniref:hypothetical protein n=1 Tax=Algibacter sp. 2305UL17-15 TaxID=3231268 RepID=UPI003457DA89
MLLFLVSNISAQSKSNTENVKEIFEKVKNNYETKNFYSFNIKYQLFKSANATVVEEFYTGKIIKNEAKYYSKINNTEFIQIEDIHLKINHDEKAMLYLKQPVSSYNSLIELASFLKFFEQTNIELKQDTYVCELVSKNITVLPYSKVIVYIDAKTYCINKQVLFLLNQQNFEDDKGNIIASNPRLEIIFSPVNHNPISGEKFVLSKYVSLIDGNIKPSKHLKGYQIINTTL